MRKLNPTLLCLVFSSFPCVLAQQADHGKDTCERVSLPFSFPSDLNVIAPDLKLGIVNHFLAFHPQAEGTLILQNKTEKLINGITMLVNYDDEQGRRIFTIIY